MCAGAGCSETACGLLRNDGWPGDGATDPDDADIDAAVAGVS